MAACKRVRASVDVADSGEIVARRLQLSPVLLPLCSLFGITICNVTPVVALAMMHASPSRPTGVQRSCVSKRSNSWQHCS